MKAKVSTECSCGWHSDVFSMDDPHAEVLVGVMDIVKPGMLRAFREDMKEFAPGERAARLEAAWHAASLKGGRHEWTLCLTVEVGGDDIRRLRVGEGNAG